MIAGFGAIEITAARSGGRTVLERVRYEGVSRCSRAFAHGDAAMIILSQLGPGVVRGDRTTVTGRLRADSHLIVTHQSATRLMGGAARQAGAIARWTIDAGATLELIGEPLVAAIDAHYDASTTIDLAAGARVLLTDIACVPAAARALLRTIVRQAGSEVLYDAFDAAASAPAAVGSFAVVGVRPEENATLLDALDAVAVPSGVRVGIGALGAGAFARVVAADAWSVRCALAELRAAALPALFAAAGFTRGAPGENQRAGGVMPAVGSPGGSVVSVSAPV